MGATIQPDRVLRELSELWVSFGKQEGDASTGVLRACAMTLVVVDDALGNAADVGETLATLMHDHPSRAIVVRVIDSEKPELEARVFAQCWMPQGHRRQICCEQIEITSSNVSLIDLPAVMLPLVVADLPVILWSRIPRLFGSAALNQLSKIATKTIVDSTAFPDALPALKQLASSGLVLGDLAWTRLTRWREQIAQIFENPCYSCDIKKIAMVVISYRGETPPAGARYMAAWIRASLERAGSRPQIRLEKAEATGDGGISRIEFSAADPAVLRVSVRRVEGTCAEVSVNALTTRTVFPETSDYALLREELSISSRDPIFEAALAIAAQSE